MLVEALQESFIIQDFCFFSFDIFERNKGSMCPGEAYGSFEPGNRWVESEGISGTTANIKLQASSRPSQDFQINAQFSVPVTSIEVWKFTAKRTRNQNLWVFTAKSGYSYDTNLDFTANILGETEDPNSISAIIVFCDQARVRHDYVLVLYISPTPEHRCESS